MTSNYTEIDYLSEDPEIQGQRYALISVVGPNLTQKCNVYGIKVRGVADSMDRAKQMSKKIHNSDPDFDIFTVDVGKFVPLDVDPLQLKDVEYNNAQLNQLVKGYLENRESATEEYEKRRIEMRKQAILDGKLNKNKSDNDTEQHPVAILNRINELNEQIAQSKQKMEEAMKALAFNQTEFDKFTLDVQTKAKEDFEQLKAESESNANKSTIRKLGSEVQVTDTDLAQLN